MLALTLLVPGTTPANITQSLSGTPVPADKGRLLFVEADRRNSGYRDMQVSLQMVLVSPRGGRTERSLRIQQVETQDDGDKVLVVFDLPASIRGTALLSYAHLQAVDDQWLFLPALKKTKRIASKDKNGSFMGSDLNYSDMTSPDLDLYDYTLMKETEVRGEKVWQIKSVPKNKDEAKKTGYSKSVVFIRQDNFVMVRGVRWVYKKKRNKYLDVRKLEKIDGIWVSTEMHVTTKSGKKTLHKTIMKQKNIHFNQDKVNENLFTIRRLEKGL